MSNIGYIYGLIDPRDNQLRYIGKTYNTKDRLWQHINEAKKKIKNNKKVAWIRSLLYNNIKPELIILEKTEDLNEAEIFYIGYFKFIGANLTNMTNGGDGLSKGCKVATAWKKGHKPWNTGKIGVNMGNKGVKRSEETKRKCSLAQRGKQHISSRKPIISTNINTGEEKYFESISEVLNIGYNTGAVFRCIQTRVNKYKNCIWRYASDVPIKIPEFKGRGYSRKLIRIDPNSNEEYYYEKTNDVLKDGFDRRSIYKAIKFNWLHKGYRWKYGS